MTEVPAKTFLMGEYAAMFGAPALLALTRQCFRLNKSSRLHPNSPAARLWTSQTGLSCDWGLYDPYLGRGGLGASSAEFILAYRQLYPEATDLEHLYRCYQTYAYQGQGMPPSGYDVLAQTKQGCVMVQSNPLNIRECGWNFEELGFVLLHTGKKLATHEHLGQLQELAWKKLIPDLERACQAILEIEVDVFLAAIHGFGQQLAQLGLVAKHTQVILDELNQHLPLLAAKGCGAMGADVVVLFSLRKDIDYIVEFLNQTSYLVLATQQDLYAQNAKK